MTISKIPDEYRRVWLPYCFEPMTREINERHDRELAAMKEATKGKPWEFNLDAIYPRAREHTYLPLNRDYKPLGMWGEWVEYIDFPEQFVRFTVAPEKMVGIWLNNTGCIAPYLYCDGPETHRTYGERYGRLLNYLSKDWRDIRGDRRTRYKMKEAGLLGA